jgi:hypothetical protein
VVLGQPRTAALLFQDALDHAGEGHVLRPFVRDELARLQPATGAGGARP